MSANHDKKTNPDWPFDDHGPTERARRLASAYRSALERVAPDEAAVVDARARAFGEVWMFAGEQLVDDDRELTTEEAAKLAGVSPKTIRNWATMDHPEVPGKKLLPRSGRSVVDRRETTYLAKNVREAVKVRRRVQFQRTHTGG